MSLTARLSAMEQSSEARIALAKAGKLPFGVLTDAELEFIVAETPPELSVLYHRFFPLLTNSQLERFTQNDLAFEELSLAAQDIFRELVAESERIYGPGEMTLPQRKH